MAQEERDTHKEGLLKGLNDWTPLAQVVQKMVASYLEGVTTLFVAEGKNHVIRAVNLEDFSVRTLAGQPKKRGHADGKGPAALFNLPRIVEVDKASNALFVAQLSCIRRTTTDGVVSTLCGDPEQNGYCEGVGIEAKFQNICGLVVVGRSLFVSDCKNHIIRRIPLDGHGSSQLFAGTPVKPGHVDGKRAKFNFPQGLVADCDGNLFVADCGNHRIRKITPAGVVSTVAGGKIGYRDGPLNEAKFSNPIDVAFDGRGRLLVVDFTKPVIRSIDFEANVVTTIAGQPGTSGNLDGSVGTATLEYPFGLAVDVATGNVFVGSLDHTIRRVSPDGSVQTVCGKARNSGHHDGIGAEARFLNPRGLALI